MNYASAVFLYLNVCQVSSKLSQHTIRAYTKDLCLFEELHDAEKLVCDFTKQDLERFVFHLSYQGHKQTSIKRRLASLRAFFKWLEVQEIIELNPFNKLALKLKTPYQLPKNIPRSDLSRMLKVARLQFGITDRCQYQQISHSCQQPNVRQWQCLNVLVTLEILIATGIRVGELVGIQLEQLELHEARIRIKGKGQRERYVFIPDEDGLNLLQQYLIIRNAKYHSHPFLIINSRGNPASTQYIRKLVKELAKQANVQRNITPHMYRHSAACELLEAGTDIRYVQRLLGHHSISTTQLYTHVNDKVLKEQIVNANVVGGI